MARPAPFPRAIANCLALLGLALAVALGSPGAAAAAEDVHRSPDDFLTAAFGGKAPRPGVLWIRGAMRGDIREILGHPYPGIRVRYWRRGTRTAWILEEIGKYKPITAGFVVDRRRIQQVEVLIYRESHGWEVRYPFFTDQFKDIRLTRSHGLSRDIDGISGATLSVSALTRLATLALYFAARVDTVR